MQNNTKVKVVGISARKGESVIPANIISKKDNINTAPSLCIYADYNGSCLMSRLQIKRLQLSAATAMLTTWEHIPM